MNKKNLAEYFSREKLAYDKFMEEFIKQKTSMFYAPSERFGVLKNPIVQLEPHIFANLP